MNILAMSGFIQTLTDKTLSGDLSWDSLYELQENTEENNKYLSSTLFQDEFHTIIFSNSFYCLNNSSGYVYLINEKFESGYDGSVISGPNIYIQKDASSRVYKLTVDLGQIYQLQNAILYSKEQDDKEIQDFIDNYYNE